MIMKIREQKISSKKKKKSNHKSNEIVEIYQEFRIQSKNLCISDRLILAKDENSFRLDSCLHSQSKFSGSSI